MTLIAPTLQALFTDRLLQQRQASPQTIAAYRDTLRLLLTFVHQRTGKMPAQLDWDDLDAGTVSAFLNHLETAPDGLGQAQRGVIVSQAPDLHLGFARRPGDRDPLAPQRFRRGGVARVGDGLVLRLDPLVAGDGLAVTQHRDMVQARGNLDPAADDRRVDGVVVGVQPDVIVTGQPQGLPPPGWPGRPAAGSASRSCPR